MHYVRVIVCIAIYYNRCQVFRYSSLWNWCLTPNSRSLNHYSLSHRINFTATSSCCSFHHIYVSRFQCSSFNSFAQRILFTCFSSQQWTSWRDSPMSNFTSCSALRNTNNTTNSSRTSISIWILKKRTTISRMQVSSRVASHAFMKPSLIKNLFQANGT